MTSGEPEGAELIRLLEAAGRDDAPSLDALVHRFRFLVETEVDGRPGSALDRADLVQEGMIGLLTAIRTFIQSEEPDFEKMARGLIAQRLDAATGEEEAAAEASRRMVEDATRLEAVQVSLAAELRREPTPSEVAAKLGWSLLRTVVVMDAVELARDLHDREIDLYADPAEAERDFTGPEWRPGGSGRPRGGNPI